MAVIFGVKKFHTYVFGRPFTIVTDHKPLIALFNERREVPQMASPRIQRWAVTLGGYVYTIVYRAGREHQNADGLSRLPLSEKGVETPAEEERVLLLDENDVSLIKAEQVEKWTDKDPVLARCLRQSFSQHGLPEIVVSDNGSCFTSKEFHEFMSRNGIKHITTAPYRAASNGLAERAVQTFKSLMKKTTGGSIEARIARALFSYRITPQSTTGKSPAELLCGRKLRSTLDLIHPDFKSQVQDKQLKQKWYHDQHAKERHLSVSENVYTKNFSSGPTCISGTVQKRTGPLSYTIALGSGQVVRRHIDQVRNSQVVSPAGTAVGLESSLQDVTELPLTESVSPAPSGDCVGQPTSETTTEVTVSETLKAEEQPELRRSMRTRKLYKSSAL
ncbi:putative protein K02A2.6-like protein [Labeo rohita]|uniref:Integrase catalytic domain-containing protein n=1 Tax=Labeo rohita TaxID=84645 RepID=A0A498P281_LABRO|nr:putative protein K02A2.6-like protein [Labeo rohita]